MSWGKHEKAREGTRTAIPVPPTNSLFKSSEELIRQTGVPEWMDGMQGDTALPPMLHIGPRIESPGLVLFTLGTYWVI